VAGELGFELPPTLVTTNAAALLDFHRRHDGRIISKVAGPTLGRFYGPDVGRYTEPVTTRDIGYFDAVRFAPAIYQACVDKRVELRITVVGERVFPVEIHSQDAARTRGDWRRYDLGLTPHRLHALPEALTRRCVQLVRRLGLAYGAIDMILTPEDRYVFIEINPNGQFLWIEQLVRAGIGEAIADCLAAYAQAHARLPLFMAAGAEGLTPAHRNEEPCP
jgi:glutathione synthase/RimK-type ligase-like ATP-grasp enzyme